MRTAASEAVDFATALLDLVDKKGEARESRKPLADGALVDLGEELRLVLFGLGALVASADGVSRREERALDDVAEYLGVPVPVRNTIREIVEKAASTAEGLTALLGAYGQSRERAAPRLDTESLREQARVRLFELPTFDATEVSELLGSRSRNQRQYAATLRRRGELLALRRSNRYLYPRFQFDRAGRRVHPEVAEVGKLLGAATDPWGVASFWVSPHPRLAGRAPMDLVGTREAGALPELARGMVEAVG